MAPSNADAGRRKGLVPVINVTPLVDVVLVLLIIFMVVIPNMQDGKHVEILSVEAADTVDAKDELAIVTIAADETYALGDDDMTRDGVLAALRRTHADAPNTRVLLRGDARLPYRVVRDFFAELQGIGLAHVSLAVGVARQWPTEEG